MNGDLFTHGREEGEGNHRWIFFEGRMRDFFLKKNLGSGKRDRRIIKGSFRDVVVANNCRFFLGYPKAKKKKSNRD